MKKFLIFMILLSILIFGCKDTSSPRLPLLPINASNMMDIGNGWYTFELNEMKFLYHKFCSPGVKESECITRIE